MPPDPSDGASPGRKGEQDAWGAFGLMISGVAVWGGVGWLLSEWLDSRFFLMLGLLVGMGAALYLVWFKYGRS
jgi:F0F1-type ATP synthase assembly protein I